MDRCISPLSISHQENLCLPIGFILRRNRRSIKMRPFTYEQNKNINGSQVSGFDNFFKGNDFAKIKLSS